MSAVTQHLIAALRKDERIRRQPLRGRDLNEVIEAALPAGFDALHARTGSAAVKKTLIEAMVFALGEVIGRANVKQEWVAYAVRARFPFLEAQRLTVTHMVVRTEGNT